MSFIKTLFNEPFLSYSEVILPLYLALVLGWGIVLNNMVAASGNEVRSYFKEFLLSFLLVISLIVTLFYLGK